MLIPDVFNAPRLCRAGGKFFWVRKIDLEGFGIILNWLDDVLPGERTELPKLSDPESQKALESWSGIVLLVWIALREHGVTYEEAAGLYAFDPTGEDAEDPQTKRKAWEQFHLLNCLFGRRRTLQKDASEIGEDISKTWCGKGMAEMAQEYGIDRIGKLSLDQFEWLSSRGTADEATRWGDLAAVQAEFFARLPAIKAAMEVTPSTP